jgi:hypothetical protein
MVIGIVLIVTIGSVVRAVLGVRRDHKGNEFFHRDGAGDAACAMKSGRCARR